ncbi:FAD linked oxidase domain protein (plasmid) [Rhizobium leguminosarum bv. trifolii WSM2304]|uniref:FAD linked oxidase domain protein n=1 Tax=Rhizobium leguminosarum bv. trifolii (strain WSM2304) TaxID=395492 RepID=A0ABF7QZU7_RHILW|nr:FAD-binding oxidoreductase [Rhizobium leguminosarum]ACI59691.1 FAD linked oxidase domain protein [Rhizobium leguminosarum bv. trifolii WSM2304]
MTSVETALSKLPADIVVRDQDIVSKYTTDFRHLYAGRSMAVLRPRTVAEVQLAVRTLAAHGVPVVPQGGNTSYCTAATPNRDGSEIVISLERLNKVRELDIGNLSMTVDAGCVLSDLQDAALDNDLMLPLSLGSEQSCQIGGNLSTNAGGIAVVKHGMARELVLGLEVVLPDGSLFSDLNPLRKNNSGYDMKQLFIGGEGTLGIITGASLKLVRKPRAVVTAFLAIREISVLSTLLDRAQRFTGDAVTSFEYMSNSSLDLLLSKRPNLRRPLEEASDHYVLLEAATSSHLLDLRGAAEILLEEAMSDGLVIDGAVAANEEHRSHFWHLRENIPEGEVLNGGSVKHDVSVRTSRLAAFIVDASDIVRSCCSEAILSVYGHVGDGNVHFNVVPPHTAQTHEFKEHFERTVSPLIYNLAAQMGGSFSAEYGIGRSKLGLLSEYGDPGKIALMRKLKTALDPNGIMNPGKVIPVA